MKERKKGRKEGGNERKEKEERGGRDQQTGRDR